MPNLKMPQINQLIVSGRITGDLELKHVGDNNAVCNTSLAIDDGWGDKKKPTIFIDCTFWGKTAEIAADQLHKGSPVILEGRIRTDDWEDKATGAKRSKITMTVNRVHGLAWDDDGQEQPAPQGSQATSKEPPF